jgi:hypothetical protein
MRAANRRHREGPADGRGRALVRLPLIAVAALAGVAATALITALALVIVFVPLKPPPSYLATPLKLATWNLALPPGATWACGLAPLGPVRVAREDGTLKFVPTGDASPVAIDWPHGFLARLIQGHAELVASDGEVVAREGEIISDASGGFGPTGDTFDVSSVGGKCYHPVP